MKCEICKEKNAETAIAGCGNGEELYVCKECARKERVKRQKARERTRKVSGLPPGVEMSITEIGGNGGGSPVIGAIMNALNDIVGEFGRHRQESGNNGRERKKPAKTFPSDRVPDEFRIHGMMQLEGLYLIGEIEQAKRAAAAIGMELRGISLSGVGDAGHAYSLHYCGSPEQARRFARDLIAQERNARTRLADEMPRVLADALGRALALLKNCRMLSSGELFDLLSTLRLGAAGRLLDGITAGELVSMIDEIDITADDGELPAEERDRIDGERADATNARFEDVVLNERAEELPE